MSWIISIALRGKKWQRANGNCLDIRNAIKNKRNPRIFKFVAQKFTKVKKGRWKRFFFCGKMEE